MKIKFIDMFCLTKNSLKIHFKLLWDYPLEILYLGKELLYFEIKIKLFKILRRTIKLHESILNFQIINFINVQQY